MCRRPYLLVTFWGVIISAAVLIGASPAIAWGSTPTADFGGVVVLQNSGVVPVAVTRDASGNLYIADQAHGEVIKQAADGTQTIVASGLSFSAGAGAGLAVDGSGNVYIGESNTVVKETLSGSTYTASTMATGYDGNAVAVDGSGDVFVATKADWGRCWNTNPAEARIPLRRLYPALWRTGWRWTARGISTLRIRD